MEILLTFRRFSQLTCLLLLLYTSVTVTLSWQTLVTTLALLGSIFLFGDTEAATTNDETVNPLKGKPRCPLLTKEQTRNMENAVFRYVTYDAENAQSVTNMDPIKRNTECIFAKTARIWGSPEWKEELTLEENVYRILPTFYQFTMLCEQLGLDMFVLELPGKLYGLDIEMFANAFRRTLKVMSDHDPKKVKCMNRSYVGKKGWVFEFNRLTFFITTFAPFYPPTHSRHAHGCEHCYVAFQPEISFAQHDLPPDTPETNWDNPVTVRDKIRLAFKNAGRAYQIRDTIYYAPSADMIKPIEREGRLIKWWKPKK
ncbi:uncharacterized protein LOC121390460 [Gigantopelta aegis]|uniref:uncharacterized protein LOC121390460 n=1 Tax=Gigantopelta aegis TaxID=1735272 RepID=UPI001B88DB54|nr:uncharacterized protein LOC121390460 [Gigantopelta aegis]